MFTKAKIKEALGVNDRLFILIAIPVLAFFIPLLFFQHNLKDGVIAFLPKFFVSLTYTTVYWISVRALCIHYRLKFPSYRETRKRLIYHTISVIIIFSVVDLLCQPLHDMFHSTQKLPHWQYTVISFSLVLMISAIYESIFLYYRWKNSVLETERLRRENIQSQLEGLKNQVNPHFLFNSLNTLAYLIPENSEKAVCFVQKLSKVYRYILEIRDKKLISLEEELDFLQSYVFLLRERFGENISIDIRIEDQIKHYYIIPLSLQILFENAVKHNVISKDRKLKIEVFSEGQTLTIKNNLQKKILTVPSTKIGLKNIRNRYSYFINQKVEVLETPNDFIVKLPLIKAKISEVSTIAA